MNLIHNSVHVCARRGSGLAGRPACRRHALWYAIFRIRMPEIAVFQCATIEDARAEFRLQRQKLRGQPTELLKEFRGQARISSMIAHSKTVFFSIYGFINVILTCRSGYQAVWSLGSSILL